MGMKNLSFAHLVGFGKKAKAEVDDEDKEKDDGERDHEDGVKKGKKAEDEKDKEKMDEDEDDDSAEDDSPKKEDEDDKKSKKSKADDGDDDEDDKEDKETEMRGSSVAADARRREQARCAAIFSSPSAAKNPELAANLAFKTRMPRSEALAVLEGTKVAPVARYDRSARNPNVGVGASHGMTSKQAVAKSLDDAFAKVKPRR